MNTPMSNLNSFGMTSSSPKRTAAIAVLAGLVLMGQGCQISFGEKKTTDGGVYRSDDHAQTWKQRVFVRQENERNVTLSDATIRVLIFDPSSRDRIMIGTRENGIWYSENGGDQWKQTSLRSGDVPCIAHDPITSSTLYATTGATIQKSTDSGLTWKTIYTESQPGHGLACVLVHPASPSILWGLTTGGKLVSSDDAGSTWSLRQTIPASAPRLMYVDPSEPTTMYIFTRSRGVIRVENNGASWQEFSKPLKKYDGGGDVTDVEIVAGASPYWLAATGYGLLRSTDRGETWTAMSTLVTPGSAAVQNIAVNPRSSDEMFLTIGQKLHRTTDGGATWTVSSLPTARTPVWLSFDPFNIDRLYVGTFRPVKQ